MNLCNLLKMSCPVVLAVAAGLAQSPTTAVTRCAGFQDPLATPSALLELRLVGTAAAPTLEVRGGTPGMPALIAVADSVQAPPIVGHGVFDAEGRFGERVDLGAWLGRSFVCQGYSGAWQLDGRWTMQSSNGLCVQVLDPAREPGPAQPNPLQDPNPDFSLLRIQLDAPHVDAVKNEIAARDLVGVLGAALNSDGDTLQAKVSGKVLVAVAGVPVQLGGSVAFEAKIARDSDDYLVSVGEEVAVLAGVKASKDVGVEGGVMLGADEIYRFASPAEVARGLLGIALQQAMPVALDAARGENLAKVRQLRRQIDMLVNALDRLRSLRLFRNHALEAGIDAALGAVVAAHARLHRIGDLLDRVAGWVVDEARFVRDHVDGSETRIGVSCEVTVKLGSKSCGMIGAELGGKLAGGYQATVRTFQHFGEEAQRIEVLLAHVGGGSFGATAKFGGLADDNERAFARGFEISQKVTRGLRTVLVREHGAFVPHTSIVIQREFGLLAFGRTTTFEVDVAQLGAAGRELVAALVDGDPAEAALTLLGVTAHATVQDRLTMALKPEFGIENPELTAKVSGEFSWADCGPKREALLSLANVIERLADVDRTRSELRQLVQDVLALPALQ
jgi:hypothetical protein